MYLLLFPGKIGLLISESLMGGIYWPGIDPDSSFWWCRISQPLRLSPGIWWMAELFRVTDYGHIYPVILGLFEKKITYSIQWFIQIVPDSFWLMPCGIVSPRWQFSVGGWGWQEDDYGKQGESSPSFGKVKPLSRYMIDITNHQLGYVVIDVYVWIYRYIIYIYICI